ncbi:MAG: hypothetical protein EOP45_14900 [Sphingobacteriaceae bacterium]|nr:MAG: hypothetical protein EOP45_14900 [Sphingobacteriaceae bacterium]
MKNDKISLSAVRNANGKLVSRDSKSVHVISDNSKNGAVKFRAEYMGKSYDLSISKDAIKDGYAKSLAKTSVKKK